jgi:hypothetical protein
LPANSVQRKTVFRDGNRPENRRLWAYNLAKKAKEYILAAVNHIG